MSGETLKERKIEKLRVNWQRPEKKYNKNKRKEDKRKHERRKE